MKSKLNFDLKVQYYYPFKNVSMQIAQWVDSHKGKYFREIF